MSIFASRVQKTLEIPFDPPHTVTIKKLSGKHLGQAALENQLHSIDAFRQMGGAKFQRELNEIREAPKADATPAIATAPDPLAGYDKDSLIKNGIVGWTYDVAVPVTDQTLDDLTDEASDFFARNILRLSKPALFLTADEAEAELKNEPGPSIAS